jgi:hypothetical protein
MQISGVSHKMFFVDDNQAHIVSCGAVLAWADDIEKLFICILVQPTPRRCLDFKFFYSLSHRICGHMYGAVNIDKK